MSGVGWIGGLAAASRVDTTEDETGMMWGDLGRVYYRIRHDDLLRRRWDRVWPVMQCG